MGEYQHFPIILPDSRDPRLPQFICYSKTHPLWHLGNAYVYEWDVTPERQRAYHNFMETREVAGRFEQDLLQAGEMELKPYEAVFARKLGEMDPNLDILQAFLTDENHLETVSASFYEELLQLRDEILGPEALRTPAAPRKGVDGIFHGGVFLERSLHRTTPAVPGTRCYQYQGLSTEIPRNVSSANANSKIPQDRDRELRTRMLKKFMAAALATINLAPSTFHEAARMRADLVNAPRIGHDDNIHFTQVQLNISRCYRHNSKITLEQLGNFGDKHIDDHDHEAKLTVAGAFSHMPDTYHPGLFILYDLGVFVRLNTGRHICFSGLRHHGGTPPTAPEGQEPVHWACRCLHIAYPSEAITNMQARQALGPIPGDEVLYIPPEMMEHCIPDLTRFPLYTKRANYIQDGVGIMSPTSHMTFVSRLLLRLCQHQIASMPYNVHINTDKFLSSFEYDDIDGARHTVPSWQFAERIASLTPEQEQEYQDAWNLVDEHAQSTRVFIPHVAGHKEAHMADNTFQKLKDARGSEFIANFQRPILMVNKGTKRPTDEDGSPSKRKKGKKKAHLSESGSDIDKEITTSTAKDTERPTVTSEATGSQVTLHHTLPNQSSMASQEQPMEGVETTMPQDPIPSNTPQVCTFIHALTLDALVNKLEEVLRERERFHKQAGVQNKDQATITSQLSAFLSNAFHDPLEDRTVRGIGDAWHTLNKLKGANALCSFQTRVWRQHVMLANARTWSWIDQICTEEVASIIGNKYGGRKAWTQQLVTVIHNFLETQSAAQLVLQRKDYSPFANMGPRATEVKQRTAAGRYPRLLTGKELSDRTVQVMKTVIADWLDFPAVESMLSFQAFFINTLMDITGSTDILLLDATWKAYSYPKRRLFNNKKLVSITSTHMSQLSTCLKQQAFAIENSPEMAIIKDLASLHMAYGAWSPIKQREIGDSSVQAFIKFLRTLDPILTNAGKSSTDTPLIRKVKSNLDFYLPFREHAPSRQHITSPHGPYHPDFIKTRGGLFSALIYRGITYGAPAEHDPHHNKFHDLQDWLTYYQSLTNEALSKAEQKTDQYFCNIRAYGTPNRNRTPNLAAEYWEKTQDWEEFISDLKPCFLDMQNYLLEADTNGDKRFPNIGALAAYLLTVDLCYAGIVQEPSTETVGQLIFNMKLGSYKQLVELQVLDPNDNVKECGHAFKGFYDDVCRAVTTEEMHRWSFSPFIMEHSLCKRSRLRAFL